MEVVSGWQLATVPSGNLISSLTTLPPPHSQKTSFAGAGHQPIVSGLITPPITPNTQHYVGVLAALIAPTEIHVEQASTTASHSQHHQAHRSYNSMSADLPPPTTGAAQDIRQPFEDLGAYAARAYLPPIPEHINSVLEEHQTKLLAKNINWGMAKTIKDVRSVRVRELGVLNSQPKGGRRTLAEIEQIDGECLARAAFSCKLTEPLLLFIVLPSRPRSRLYTPSTYTSV